MLKYKVLKKLVDNNISYIDEIQLGAYSFLFNSKEIQTLIDDLLDSGFITPAGLTKPDNDADYSYPRYRITYKAEEYVNNYRKNELRTTWSFYLSIVAILLSIYSTFFK